MKRTYPKSRQGGLWKNHDANSENREPPYRGHIVVTEEMLKVLVVLMRNNAWKKKDDKPDLGPRINFGAWLNTGKGTGEKYFGLEGDVYYPKEYNYLFDDNSVPLSVQEAPAPAPAPKPVEIEPDDDDFPF